MIPGIIDPAMCGAGGASQSMEQTDNVNAFTSWANPVTFSSVDLGAAATGRVIVAAVAIERSAYTASPSVTSATINGVTATVTYLSSGSKICAILSATVSTGATGNIVINLSAGTYKAGAIVFAAYGGLNTTPHHTDTDLTTAGSINLNIPADGLGVAVHRANINAAGTFSGLSNLKSGSDFGAPYTIAGSLNMSEETARSIVCTQTGSAEATLGASFAWE